MANEIPALAFHYSYIRADEQGFRLNPRLSPPTALLYPISIVIIDLRCRFSPSAQDYYRERMARYGGTRFTVNTAQDFIRELDTAGVTLAVSASGNSLGLKKGDIELPPRRTSNDEQAALQNEYPQRILGVAAIMLQDNMNTAVAELERCVTQLGLRVAAIEPGRLPLSADNPADKRIYPFYERAQQLGIPLILLMSGPFGGKTEDYAHPRWIDQVAKDFPELHLVCAHACHPFHDALISVLQQRRNVFASPDVYLYTPPGHRWVRAVNSGKVSDQFLFASGFPLVRDLKQTVNRFMLQGWKPARLSGILFHNAVNALKLGGYAPLSLPKTDQMYGAGKILAAGLSLIGREAAFRLRGK